MDRKRRRSELEGERNKKHNSSEAAVPRGDSTVYRILCPGNVLGSLMGKGGHVINSLRKESRSKIKVADPVPGVDERVVIIFSSPSSKDPDPEAELEPVCPAQDALLRVHSVIARETLDKDDKKQVIARLLFAKSQIGTLIGKGGKNIQKMRSDSAANIQVLRKDQLPACALPIDELVQIAGDVKVVKKALHVVLAFPHGYPPKEQIPWNDVLPGPVSQSQSHSSLVSSLGTLFPPASYLPQPNSFIGFSNMSAPIVGLGSHYLSGCVNGGGSAPGLSGFGAGPSAKKGPEEVTLCILCPSDKIGGVTGKGGNHIKRIRPETGANIKVEDAKPESDECVIIVSSTEERTSDGTDKDGAILKRLLVPSKQIGCLVGKGGNVITEMRKSTRANIRIFYKDERPKCASEDEELVQITAEASIARRALIQIIRRLRDNVFKDKDGVNNTDSRLPNSLSGLAIPGVLNLSSSYGARHDLGSPGRTGVRSAGLRAPQDEARSYASHSLYASTQTFDGRLSGGHLNSTYGLAIEETIPNSAVGSFLGRGGTNISHIRQVSGAILKLHDPIPGASDCVIEISGI